MIVFKAQVQLAQVKKYQGVITSSNKVKLQKIITQKWIAGFPEGQEAWSEYRRTGYPKLFRITNN